MQSLRCPQLAQRPLAAQERSRRTLVVVNSTFDVRPYTLRKGDTLESIASKRDFNVEQLLGLNPGLKPSKAKEGETILLPANKLSSRDKEILGGMGSTYRLYPVRSGETLEDIMSKRKITTEEMRILNPDLDFKKGVKSNQVLKLPNNKFTVREREMLIGSGIVPAEFFAAAKNPFVIGLGGLLMVCGFVMAWQQFNSDPDMQATD